MSDKLWFLQRCELFQHLDPQQTQWLEMRSRRRSFAAGTPVYLPTESADSLFLLISGLVKICHLTPDGKQSILAFVEPGGIFGELAILDGDARDEYVEAVEQSTVVMIPKEAIQQLMTTHCDVSTRLTKLIGMRYHRIQRRLKNLLFRSGRERLVHLLLDLAEQFGEPDGSSIRLRIKLSHQELANLIGTTRETATAILGRLRAQRCVAGGRRRIVLTDPLRLAQSVHRNVPELGHGATRSVGYRTPLVATT